MAVSAVKCGGQETKAKARAKAKGKAQGDEHADGWTWSGEHADAWWKTTDWQRGLGSGWWTTANCWTPWESEEPMGLKDAAARTLEGAQNKE